MNTEQQLIEKNELLYALNQIQELPWRLIMVGTGEYETEFKQITLLCHSPRIKIKELKL